MQKSVDGNVSDNVNNNNNNNNNTNIMDNTDMKCIICFERTKNVVILPCKHLIGCSQCIPLLNGICPIDRQNFTEVMTIFNS